MDSSAILKRLPNLRTSDEGERRAAWLELFFDLVFAFAITELAQYLHNHESLSGLLTYLALFVPIWWTWTGFSFYADQFDPDTVIYRVVMLVAMLLIMILAVNIQGALDTHAIIFIAAYTALQLLLSGLYLWACRDASVRPMFVRFALGFFIGTILWLTSIWVPAPARYWLWGLALFIEIATPAISHLHVKTLRQRVSHIPERLGVFTLIVLGETVIVVGTGLTDTDWQTTSIITAIAGFIIAACIWWLYFDRIDTTTLSYGLAGNKRKIMQAFGWCYIHFFIFTGLTAISVGIELAIHAGTSTSNAQTLLCAGIAVTLLAMSIIHHTGPQPLSRGELLARLLTIVSAIVLALIRVELNPLLVCGLFVLLLGGSVVCEVLHFTHINQPMRNAARD